MSLQCAVDFFEYDFPIRGEPTWHAKVERWYQLDAPAYGFCELWSKFETSGAPDMIFLASPGGSNSTDAQFVKAGASSPAKFVHTLPNIRASSLLQLMNWHGPLLCLQMDPTTIASAIAEAYSMAGAEKSIWILGHVELERHMAFRVRIGEQGPFKITEQASAPALDDRGLLNWLKAPGRASFGLPSGLEIQNLEAQ